MFSLVFQPYVVSDTYIDYQDRTVHYNSRLDVLEGTESPNSCPIIEVYSAYT